MCFEIRIPFNKTNFSRTFYKVLFTDGNGNYFTPFVHQRVVLGVLYETKYKGIAPKVKLYETYRYIVSVQFNEGVYHLCKNKREAKKLYNNMLSDPRFSYSQYKPIIVKAYVPKGSLLIKGFNEPYCVVNKVMYNK